MSILDKLFSNEKIKDMAFSMLKKTMAENDYSMIVITLGTDNEFKLEPFKAEALPIVISANVQAQIETLIKGKDEVIESLTKSHDTWEQKCREAARELLVVARENKRLLSLLHPGKSEGYPISEALRDALPDDTNTFPPAMEGIASTFVKQPSDVHTDNNNGTEAATDIS